MASQVEKDRAYTRHRLPKEWTLDASKLAFTVDDVLDAKECSQLIQMADASGWKPSPMAPLQTGLRARFDNDAWARTIRKAKAVLPAVHKGRRLSRCHPDFPFVKYPEGASVAPHRSSGGDKLPPSRAAVLFTILLYLNDGYEAARRVYCPRRSRRLHQQTRGTTFSRRCITREDRSNPKRHELWCSSTTSCTRALL